MKSGDDEQAWKDLIQLCKLLNETPADQLVAKLSGVLDIDETLWFLALDCSLVNSDGYWTRASDYSIYQDESRKFHLVPHDMNEAFHGAMGGGPGGGPGGRGGRGGPGGGGERGRPREEGAPPGDEPRRGPPGEEGPRPEGPGFFDFLGFGGPGGPGGPGGFGPGGFGGPGGMNEGGVDLDPLIGLENPRMPLRSKLLAVPELKEKYLQCVRAIAEHSLTWY